MSDAPSSTIPGPTVQAAEWDKFTKNWANIRLGHEALMLDKIQRQNRIVEVVARNTMTGEMEDTEGLPGNDDMGVAIGNEIHNHWQSSAPADVATSGPSLASKIAPYLATALLAAGGTGLGAYVLGTPAPSTPDTDTIIEYTPGFGVSTDVVAEYVEEEDE